MADREKLIEICRRYDGTPPCDTCKTPIGSCSMCGLERLIDYLIAHGVTVRERGRWIPHYETFDADAAVGILGGTYQTGWQCSVCGRYEPGKEPYCNCGADMR